VRLGRPRRRVDVPGPVGVPRVEAARLAVAHDLASGGDDEPYDLAVVAAALHAAVTGAGGGEVHAATGGRLLGVVPPHRELGVAVRDLDQQGPCKESRTSNEV